MRSLPSVRCTLIAVIALVVTAGAAGYAVADEPQAPSKPSSFAPRGHTGQRAYGAPIQRPIMKRRSRPQRHPQPSAPR